LKTLFSQISWKKFPENGVFNRFPGRNFLKTVFSTDFLEEIFFRPPGQARTFSREKHRLLGRKLENGGALCIKKRGCIVLIHPPDLGTHRRDTFRIRSRQE
jgi:hypothetical protein